ncbi:hypothetical protein EJ08DRAFT_683321 [Tothia fuscella]|uniref:Uncharacterized protein n=1 Tax=Tothia fuscella TaxID=1048955 RepID=A0A9P4NGC8_9PEZI|nr:hypothetical protein EJ08DRAFT_683321 [Tothia fuscella]
MAELAKRVNQNTRDPGITFDMGREVFGRVMLGTRHGKAISYFLLQHKEQFGLKRIKSIRIWRDNPILEDNKNDEEEDSEEEVNPNPYWNAAFEIVDVEENEGQGITASAPRGA